MGEMTLVPVTFREACAHIDAYHRHNKPPRGMRFAIGLCYADTLAGVSVIGRPTNRNYDPVAVAEVTRLCVNEFLPKGACSMLYRASWRAWSAMGGVKLITYTLQSEGGESLRGAGFVREAELKPRQPDGWTNRGAGRMEQDVVGEAKIRWSISRGNT